MALSVSKDVLSEFVVVEKQMDEVLGDLTESNNVSFQKLVHATDKDGVIVSVHRKTEEVEFWIDDLKRDMVIATEPNNEEVITGRNIDCSEIKRKDATDVPVDILIVEGRAKQLSEKILAYKEFLLSRSKDIVLASKLDELFDLSSTRITDNYEVSWECATFEHRSFVSNLNTLTIIQIKLRLAEKEFYKSYSKNNGMHGKHILAEHPNHK